MKIFYIYRGKNPRQTQKIFKMQFLKIIEIKSAAMLEKIKAWQDAGFFNPLDFAFASTLAAIDSKTPKPVLLGSALASLALSRGNVAWNLADVPERLFAEKPQIDPEIRTAIQSLKPEDFQNQNAVFCINEEKLSPKPLVFDGKRLYLWRYFQAERKIEKNLLKRLEFAPKTVDTESLKCLFPDESDQKTACMTAFIQNFCVISGGPGTGKTTTVTKLLALILNANKQTRIALAAPTGKAAGRLKESIDSAISHLPSSFAALFQNKKDFEPSTIHRLLGHQADGFLYNESRQLPLDVLILDEASMIDLLLMESVLKALPIHAKLVLLGDDKQLASVDAGCLLNEICSAKNPQIQNAIARLNKSYRFNETRGIGQLAHAVLKQKTSAEIKAIFQKFKGLDLELITTFDDFEKMIDDFYQSNPIARTDNFNQYATQLLNRTSSFQVLCALRKGEFGVEALNKNIEMIFSKKLTDYRGKTEFFEQCPIMITENIAHLNLSNGDVGVCVWNENNRARFVFKENNSLRQFSYERLKNCAEKMFALTVHKSQGSEFKHVVLVLPPKQLPILTRELLYTGITRAREKLTIFIPNALQPFDLIHKIIQTPFCRQGGLFLQCN